MKCFKIGFLLLLIISAFAYGQRNKTCGDSYPGTFLQDTRQTVVAGSLSDGIVPEPPAVLSTSGYTRTAMRLNAQMNFLSKSGATVPLYRDSADIAMKHTNYTDIRNTISLKLRN